MKSRQWYRMSAMADETEADLYIFGDIGPSWWDDDAVSAKQFIDDLRALPASIMKARVHVNSLGGYVFDGIAIANALRAWAVNGRSVETIVEGIAASIASVVIQAGSTVKIADNAMIFVHLPWALGVGNANDMKKLAADLEAITGSITATYQWHSSLSDEELLALMEAETWLDADDAIAKGFATEKIEGLQAVAGLDPRSAAKLKVPEKFKARVDALIAKPAPDPAAPVAASAADVLRLCREGEVLDLAEGLLTAGAALDQVTARIAEAKAARAAAATRATEITALCASATLPELADGYIAGAMPIPAIKQQLATLKAKLDAVEIDGGLDPHVGGAAGSWKDAFAKANRGRITTH